MVIPVSSSTSRRTAVSRTSFGPVLYLNFATGKDQCSGSVFDAVGSNYHEEAFATDHRALRGNDENHSVIGHCLSLPYALQ